MTKPREPDVHVIKLPSRSYPIDPLPELLKVRQQLTWTIEGWLEAGTNSVLVGPESSFKSFLAIDWSLCIATGREWHGCRVKQGRVLYIAGEGRTGVIRRMRGWCDYHEASTDEVFLGRSPVQLVGAADAELIADHGPFELIVIDTLARNFGPGNENDQQDMGIAVASVDRIREATGAAVLIVHHAPLEGRSEGRLRPRGSSALSGAADSIFTCEYDREAKVVTIGNPKQKDATPADYCFLGFEVVDLDEEDNFGNSITTVVLRATESRPAPKRNVTGKNQQQLIKELAALGNGTGEVIVSIREITNRMVITREARKKLEQWFGKQNWARPSVGGHVVDLQRLPRL